MDMSLRASAIDPHRAEYETGAYKWYVAGVLCLAHMVAMVDRFVMVLVSEPVRATLHLTDTQLGLLQGTGFSLLYCAFAIPLGAIADATNRRNLIMFGLAVWSVATVMAATATSFESLFMARILVGMGEACLIPAGMSLLATYFAPDNLARGPPCSGRAPISASRLPSWAGASCWRRCRRGAVCRSLFWGMCNLGRGYSCLPARWRFRC